MDCVKNLTSCAGCTKKHARCHWRDVSRDELGALDHLMDSAYPPTDLPVTNGHGHGSENGDPHDDSDEDDSNPLEDLEALGEKEEQENQIREDEEGLRNARELARQGWQTQTHVDVDETVQTHDASRPMHESGVHAEEPEVAKTQTPADTKPQSDDVPVYEAADRLVKAHQDEDAEVSPTADHGHVDTKPTPEAAAITNGFRAVNDTTNDGNMASSGTGWRAI